MTRILCIGDLHLGTSPDFGRAPYGPESRLADQQIVWQRACDTAIEQDCDLVLFTGDAFHRRRPTPSEILAFRAGPVDLERHGIPVIAIDGNHDVTTPELPSALSIFDGEGIRVSRTPEVIDVAGVSVATLPWTPAARLIAARGGGDRDEANQDVAQILLDIARQLRAECPAGKPAILMGHWAVSGAALPAGMATDELREPVIPADELNQMGWDAIALGHIHRRQTIGRPATFYVGSPAVVDWGEAGQPHGVTIVDLDRSDAITSFVEIDDRPFVTLDADLSDDPVVYEEMLRGDWSHADLVSDAVVRFRYRATREQAARVDNREIAQALLDAGAWRVFVQPEIARQDRARVEGLDDNLTPQRALDLWLDVQALDDQTMAGRVRAQTAAYLEQVAT